MTITYVTSGLWGIGTGVPHTAAEADEIVWTLVQDILAKAAQGVGIATITTAGNVMTITLTDSTVFSVTMPAAVGDLPAGGVIGQVLTKSGSADYVVAWNNPSAFQASPVQTQSGASFTPALSDAGTYNRLTNSGGCTVTIPNYASVAFPVGTEIRFRQANLMGIFFVESSPVVLNGVAGFFNQTLREGAWALLKNVGTDEWDLSGLLESIEGHGH